MTSANVIYKRTDAALSQIAKAGGRRASPFATALSDQGEPTDCPRRFAPEALYARAGRGADAEHGGRLEVALGFLLHGDPPKGRAWSAVGVCDGRSSGLAYGAGLVQASGPRVGG